MTEQSFADTIAQQRDILAEWNADLEKLAGEPEARGLIQHYNVLAACHRALELAAVAFREEMDRGQVEP